MCLQTQSENEVPPIILQKFNFPTNVMMDELITVDIMDSVPEEAFLQDNS